MTAPRDVSFDDYMVESMKDPAQAAAYLEAVIDLEDPAALLVALRQVAKAHGMAEVARRADVGDKTFSAGRPRNSDRLRCRKRSNFAGPGAGGSSLLPG